MRHVVIIDPSNRVVDADHNHNLLWGVSWGACVDSGIRKNANLNLAGDRACRIRHGYGGRIRWRHNCRIEHGENGE